MMPIQPEGSGDGLFSLIQNLAMEVINARVRMRALLELLEEKGVIAPEEYDARGQVVWERDYEELSEELLGSGRSEEA